VLHHYDSGLRSQSSKNTRRKGRSGKPNSFSHHRRKSLQATIAEVMAILRGQTIKEEGKQREVGWGRTTTGVTARSKQCWVEGNEFE
jgi:hypothetical protein